MRVGRARARPRTLKIDCGLAEIGLMWWLAERCDFSALEHFEIKLSGGFLHTSRTQRARAAAPAAPMDPSTRREDEHSTYGLGWVLAELSGAHHATMRALWHRACQPVPAYPLPVLWERSPLLVRLDCALHRSDELRSLAYLSQLRSLNINVSALWEERSGCADAAEELRFAVSRMPRLEELSLRMRRATGTNETSHGPRLRVSSQTLRLLDVRGMDKSCEVSYLACPSLLEIRVRWCWPYSGGIKLLVRDAVGAGPDAEAVYRVVESGNPPWQVDGFGANASTRWAHVSSPPDAPCRPLDLPAACRVAFYDDESHAESVHAVFLRVARAEGSSDGSSWLWQRARLAWP